MKILYIYQYFNTPDVPGGTRAYEFARRLVAVGHTVTVVTSDFRGRFSQRGPVRRDVDGIDVIYIPVGYSQRMPFWRRILAFLLFSVRATVAGSSEAFDVVCASSTPLTTAIPGILASRLRRVPFVFETRDLWPHVPIAMGMLRNPVLIWLARRLERWAYANASRIIALSPGMADGVHRAGVPRDKIDVIPNGADIDTFGDAVTDQSFLRQAFHSVPPGPIVLYAGAVGRANAIDYIVDVAAAIRPRHPAVRFVVFGEGSQWERVEAHARAQAVLGKTFFMYGRLPKERMPDLFASATVVMSTFEDNPALFDNSANKFFDGLAAGRPVAINYGGWQAELLERHRAGLVLDRQPDVAARQLLSLLQDPQRLHDVGARARELAEARFARDQLARDFERVLVQARDAA